MVTATLLVLLGDPEPVERRQVTAEVSSVVEPAFASRAEARSAPTQVAVIEGSAPRRRGFSPVFRGEEEEQPEDGETEGQESESEGRPVAPGVRGTDTPFIAGYVEPAPAPGRTPEEKEAMRRRLQDLVKDRPYLKGIPGIGVLVREKEPSAPDRSLGAAGALNTPDP